MPSHSLYDAGRFFDADETEWLRRVKDAYDPSDLFRVRNGIWSSSGGRSCDSEGEEGGGGGRRLVSQYRACGVARVSRAVRNGWACSPRLRATLAPCDLATSLTPRTDMALAEVRLRAAGRGGWPDVSRM